MILAHPCYRSLFSHEYGVLIAAFGLLLSLLPGLPAEAAEPNTPVVRFENPLSRVEATSQQLGGINTIVQDSYGFIWMGGENGRSEERRVGRESRSGVTPQTEQGHRLVLRKVYICM